MPNINVNIPLYFTGITTHTHTHIYIYIYKTRAEAVSNGFCSSVCRPSSCIFRNWSRLSLKIYMFTTLYFIYIYIYIWNSLKGWKRRDEIGLATLFHDLPLLTVAFLSGEVIKRWGRVPFLSGPAPPPITVSFSFPSLFPTRCDYFKRIVVRHCYM